MITEDIMVEKMIEMGTCSGVDKTLCIQAMKMIWRSGGKKVPTVQGMLGADFDRFAQNYRTAFERIMDVSDIDDSHDDIKPAEPDPQKTSGAAFSGDIV